MQPTLFRAQTSEPNSIRRSKYDVRLSLTAYIKGVIPDICNFKKRKETVITVIQSSKNLFETRKMNAKTKTKQKSRNNLVSKQNKLKKIENNKKTAFKANGA